MKSKTLIKAMAILLSLLCTASVTACDSNQSPTETTVTEGSEGGATTQAPETEDNTDSITTQVSETEATTEEETIKTTVTSDEWKQAFDLSAYNSFTITYVEEYFRTILSSPENTVPTPSPESTTNTSDEAEGTESASESEQQTVITIEVSGTIQYQNGSIMAELIKKENGEGTDPIRLYAPLVVNALRDIDGFVDHSFPKNYCFTAGQALDDLYGQTEDYGYSSFTYLEETMAYTHATTYDGYEITMKLWFTNGLLKELECTTPGGKIHLRLSSFNATELADPMTKEDILSIIDNSQEQISTASACRMIGKIQLPLLGTMPFDEEADLIAPQEFLKSFEVGDILNYEINDGVLSALKLAAEGSEYENSIGAFENTVSYDYVRLTFDESGRITSIALGDAFQYQITY